MSITEDEDENYNQGDMNEDEDAMVDWGLANEDDEAEIDYKEQVMDIVAQEKMEEIKGLGVVDAASAGLFNNVINLKSIRLFTMTKFYNEA